MTTIVWLRSHKGGRLMTASWLISLEESAQRESDRLGYAAVSNESGEEFRNVSREHSAGVAANDGACSGVWRAPKPHLALGGGTAKCCAGAPSSGRVPNT